MNVDVSNISILIPSYNTPKEYLKECIDSICNQTCINTYTFEIIWINDGSSQERTIDLEESLEKFKTYKNINLIYKCLPTNQGICNALNTGLNLCSNELIFRMDSDDIMFPNRIQTQIDFMVQNPQCMICGTQLYNYEYNNNKWMRSNFRSNLPEKLSWYDYLKNPLPWFMNHPSLCYRKQAIERVGKYSEDPIIKESKMEDFELELRFLKTFGMIYNIKDPLIIYRFIIKKQANISNHNKLRKYIINKILLS